MEDEERRLRSNDLITNNKHVQPSVRRHLFQIVFTNTHGPSFQFLRVSSGSPQRIHRDPWLDIDRGPNTFSNTCSTVTFERLSLDAVFLQTYGESRSSDELPLRRSY